MTGKARRAAADAVVVLAPERRPPARSADCSFGCGTDAMHPTGTAAQIGG